MCYSICTVGGCSAGFCPHRAAAGSNPWCSNSGCTVPAWKCLHNSCLAATLADFVRLIKDPAATHIELKGDIVFTNDYFPPENANDQSKGINITHKVCRQLQLMTWYPFYVSPDTLKPARLQCCNRTGIRQTAAALRGSAHLQPSSSSHGNMPLGRRRLMDAETCAQSAMVQHPVTSFSSSCVLVASRICLPVTSCLLYDVSRCADLTCLQVQIRACTSAEEPVIVDINNALQQIYVSGSMIWQGSIKFINTFPSPRRGGMFALISVLSVEGDGVVEFRVSACWVQGRPVGLL